MSEVGGAKHHGSIGQFQPLQDLLGVERQRLQFIVRLLGGRHFDQFHLVELMLANQAPNILPIGARLASETRRVRRVAHRQVAAIENLAAVKIRQRHFGRGYQIQIPFTRDLEKILFELRKLPGSSERCAVHQERGLNLPISVLPRVQIEHEIDERP